jgi:hypothetical protein
VRRIRGIALRQLPATLVLATLESVFGRLHSLLNSDFVHDLLIARIGFGDSHSEIMLRLNINSARQFNGLRFHFGIQLGGRQREGSDENSSEL